MKGYVIFITFILCTFVRCESDDEVFDEDRIVEQINSLGSTWTAQRNFAPGTTIGDLKRLTGVKRKGNEVTGSQGIKSLGSCEIEDLPRNFDAREKWGHICPSLLQIHDQGYCGSCWAVSVTSAYTDRHCINSNGEDPAMLSSQQVTSCCQTCTDGGDGCDGGFPDEAWKYLGRVGAVTGGHYNSQEGCQPYLLQSCLHHMDNSTHYDIPHCKSLNRTQAPKCVAKCYNDKYGVEFKMDKRKAPRLEELDYCSAMMAIYTEGPISANFHVYLDFASYKSGIYKHEIGRLVGGHAVRVIGWGEEDNVQYWLVANSWNKHWGENGTFKILRGNNEVGFEDGMYASSYNIEPYY